MTNFLIIRLICLLSVVLVEPIHSHLNDEDKLSVAWCVSGQVGRFTFHEQADFSKSFDMKTTAIDVFIVLENYDAESTLVSHGNISSVPYFEEARDGRAVSKYYKERGANQVTHKLINPIQIHDYLQKLAKYFVNKIGPAVHGMVHDTWYNRYNRAGPMFYLRHLVFALAAASGDYDYFMVLREDNVFLSPYASLTAVLMKLHESSQAVSHALSSTTETEQNITGSGGQIAVDMNCDGWGAYSDKIYAADLAGGSSIFGATTQAFENFVGLWLRHGINCVHQLLPFYPENEQFAYMTYLEKRGIPKKKASDKNRRRRRLTEIEDGRESLIDNSSRVRRRKLRSQTDNTNAVDEKGSYIINDNSVSVNNSEVSSMMVKEEEEAEENNREGGRRRMKNCGWVAYRREYVCEDENVQRIDEWGHVWNTGSVNEAHTNNDHTNKNEHHTNNNEHHTNDNNEHHAVVNSNNVNHPKNDNNNEHHNNNNNDHQHASSTVKGNVIVHDNKKSTTAVPTPGTQHSKSPPPKPSSYHPQWQPVHILRQMGHIPIKDDQFRCNRREPLHPETFVQDLMDDKLVQINPIDFVRTEVRFVKGKKRPCVKSIYFNCAPILRTTRAFTSCGFLS